MPAELYLALLLALASLLKLADLPLRIFAIILLLLAARDFEGEVVIVLFFVAGRRAVAVIDVRDPRSLVVLRIDLYVYSLSTNVHLSRRGTSRLRC